MRAGRVKRTAAAVLCVLLLAGGAFPARAAESIEYADLERLVSGNAQLKDSMESYDTNRENYQSLVDSLTEEREYMLFLAKKYEGTETEQSYRSNASVLARNIEQMKKQLKRLDNKSQTVSRQKTTDTYVQAAQALMRTCRELSLNLSASEKSRQAAEASCGEMMKKQAAGMATAEDVLKASDSLSQAKNLEESYRQQAQQARFSLLSYLGLSDDGSVQIGAVPDPDLNAIQAVNRAEDEESAVNNSETVQSARSLKAGTTAEISRKAGSVAEAESSARAAYAAASETLQAAVISYQAARDAYSGAVLEWQSAQRKKQAGMQSTASYLSAEAAYLKAEAERAAASMALTESWESYQLLVKGVQ
ncbi:MAG: hypothetical protein Q4C73_05955 [Eubacteriales bacterium]|nr:hypothetical protein [Eubacteriales bacterium]